MIADQHKLVNNGMYEPFVRQWRECPKCKIILSPDCIICPYCTKSFKTSNKTVLMGGNEKMKKIDNDNFKIPTDPEVIRKIKSAMNDISDCYYRIESNKDTIKSIISDLNEKYSIPKPILNKMARLHHKDEFDKEVAKNDNMEDLYNTVYNIQS